MITITQEQRNYIKLTKLITEKVSDEEWEWPTDNHLQIHDDSGSVINLYISTLNINFQGKNNYLANQKKAYIQAILDETRLKDRIKTEPYEDVCADVLVAIEKHKEIAIALK